MLRIVLMSALILTAVVSAVKITFADEKWRTSPEMALRGGLICDTLEQVTVAIDNPRERPEGCGILRGAVRGTVSLLGTYDSGDRRFTLARYDFNHAVSGVPFPDVQYGFWGKVEDLDEAL